MPGAAALGRCQVGGTRVQPTTDHPTQLSSCVLTSLPAQSTEFARRPRGSRRVASLPIGHWLSQPWRDFCSLARSPGKLSASTHSLTHLLAGRPRAFARSGPAVRRTIPPPAPPQLQLLPAASFYTGLRRVVLAGSGHRQSCGSCRPERSCRCQRASQNERRSRAQPGQSALAGLRWRGSIRCAGVCPGSQRWRDVRLSRR